MDAILDYVTNPANLFSVIIGICAFVTMYVLVSPLLEKSTLDNRMKSVADERERLKNRQLEELNKNTLSNSARMNTGSGSFVKDIVEKFNLRKAFESEDTVRQLKNAGFRGQNPINIFLFFRLVAPILIFLLTLGYFFLINNHGQSTFNIFLIAFLGFVIGSYVPNVVLTNMITKRQDELRQNFPDTMDLLLICVESGMSIEAAFNKVSSEVSSQSIVMAEELSLTTAELSYLASRKIAYRNFFERTGLEEIKTLTTSLLQAEQYGTPLGSALRVIAQENREARMTRAEKKAAALPPKLTVPMIAFFLPVIFVVILGPSAITLSNTF